MRWIRLFRAQLTQTLRRPWLLFFVLVAAAIALSAGLASRDERPSYFSVAVVLEDEGEYGRRLIDALEDYPDLDLKVMPRDDAFQALRQDRLEGVFVIRPDFTAMLRDGDFNRVVEWYTAPSTRAAATVSEPLITETMRIWLEELAVAGTRRFLEAEGIPYSEADEISQRRQIRETWLMPAEVEIRSFQLENDLPPNGEPERLPGGPGPLDDFLRWYAVLVVFYLIVSASWVLDINKRGLRNRVVQSGGRLWQMLLGAGLAPLVIALTGFAVAGSSCVILAGGSWLRLVVFIVPMILYLAAVLGMTIFLASFLRQPMSLLFMAPLLTFGNALLSGMVASLPDWANVLVILSQALPGRWLITFFSEPIRASLFALLCATCWFLAGILVAEVRQGSRRSTS